VARDGPRLGRLLREHLQMTWAKLEKMLSAGD
jgi:hypothetical protein